MEQELEKEAKKTITQMLIDKGEDPNDYGENEQELMDKFNEGKLNTILGVVSAEPVVAAEPDAVAKTEEEEEREFFASEENKKNALVLANQIRDMVGKNWFTFQRFINKTKEDRAAGYQKLKIGEMFGYIKTKVGDFSDGKDSLRMPMWKVVISKEDHVKALQDIIQYHKNQIIQLELEITANQ
jgi:hypothetical protein